MTITSLDGENRPPRYGWAPGRYFCRCHGEGCKDKSFEDQQFIGDKRATMCADCAYALPDPPEEKLPPHPSMPSYAVTTAGPAIAGQLAGVLTPDINKAHMLCIHSLEELADLHEWLTNHPSDEELQEEGIDLAIRGRLDAWLGKIREAAEECPCYVPVPLPLVATLDLLIGDWSEVLSSHDDEFYTDLISSEG